MKLQIVLVALFTVSPLIAQTTYAVGTTPFSNSSQNEGGVTNNYFGKTNILQFGPTTAAFETGDGGVRWNGTHTSIAITVFDDPGTAGVWCLYRDGVQVSSCYTAPTDNMWGTSPAWTGLSGAHLYEVVGVNTHVTSNNNLIAEIIADGTLGAKPALKPLVAGCGDSIAVYTSTQAGQNVATDVRFGDFWLASVPVGMADTHYGAPGREVSDHASGTGTGLWNHCASQVNYNPAPAVVLLTGGVNDMYGGAPVGTPHNGDATTFEGALYAEFAAVWANSPAPLKVYQRGVVPSSGGVCPSKNDARSTTWNSYEQAVVTQWNIDFPSTPVTYIDPTNWFDSVSDVNSGDCIHPLDSGYAKMANREVPIFAGVAQGQSYTPSCPGTATTGIAITCTVTLAGSATFTGDQTITPSASGGTLSPSGAITPSAAATSFTFTFTASSSGSKTISFANGQTGWIDPSSVSVVVSSGTTSQSLIVTPGLTFALTDPHLTATEDWTVEFEIHDWVQNPALINQADIINTNGIAFNAILLTNPGSPGQTQSIQFQSKQDATVTQPNIAFPAGTNALVRVTRNHTTGQFCPEMWNIDGTGYVQGCTAITGPDPTWASFGAIANGVIGDADIGCDTGGYTCDTNAKIGFYRVFKDVAKPLGGRPPTTADGSTYQELKFDGTLTDSSGNGYGVSDAGYCGSHTCYAATPGLVPYAFIKTANAPFWAPSVPLRAGQPGQLDCGSSYSMAGASSAVTCFWQVLSGPSALNWSSHAGTTPTVTGLVFGDYNFQLQVADANGITATTTAHIGAVATDSNGVVVQANPNADLLFGPMIALGKNPWQYEDFTDLTSTQYLQDKYPTPDWATPLPGTIAYEPFYYTQPHQTTLGADITSVTQPTITLTDASLLPYLSPFPSVIMIGFKNAPIMEEVRICSAAGNVLTVCYNGRGWRQGISSKAKTWLTGMDVTMFRTSGSGGTTFVSSFCSSGAGEVGTSIYSAGTVNVTAGSPTITGNSTAWIGSGFPGDMTSFRIRISGTHGGGTPFTYFASIHGVNSSTQTINMGTDRDGDENWPADADAPGPFSYAILDQRPAAGGGASISRGWIRADATTGRQLSPISDCETDTELFTSAPDSIATTVCPGGGCYQGSPGRPYSVEYAANCTSEFAWTYYDTPLAFYAGYYRSGLNMFRDTARAIGNYCPKSPEIDEGYVGFTPRHVGLTGTVAGTVLDNYTRFDGRTNDWYAIRNFVTQNIANYSTAPCYDDTREQAYAASTIWLDAIFDSGASQTTSKAVGTAALARDQGCVLGSGIGLGAYAQPFYTGTGSSPKMPGTGDFTMVHNSATVTGSGIPASICGPVLAAGSIVLTVGSPNVTGTGFIPETFDGSGSPIYGITVIANYSGVHRLWYGTYSYTDSTHITLKGTSSADAPWQWDACPSGCTYQIEGDVTVLSFATDATDTTDLSQFYSCTWQNSGQITLDRGWEGSSGALYNATRNENNNGYNISVFQNGIKTLSLYYASLGTTTGAPGTVVGTNATGFRTLAIADANFILNNGFDQSTGGLYYGRLEYACEPPTQNRLGCSYGDTTKVPSRDLNAEAQNAMRVAYEANPTTGTRDVGDKFYGVQWGKTGYAGDYSGNASAYGIFPAPYSDGEYLEDTDSTLAHWNYKWKGFDFGVGMSHQWPAVRLGCPALCGPVTRTINVPFTLAGVTNAAKVQIILTSPTGVTASPVVCTVSPCALSGVDARVGSLFLMKLNYLNSSNVVIAPGDQIPLYVQ